MSPPRLSSRPSILFVVYIQPRSVLLFSWSLVLNHHQYADDTQLFLSFHPSDFHSNIIHLQNAEHSWMTANLLTINSILAFLLHVKYTLSYRIMSCTVSGIFDVEEYRELEISVRGYSPANLCTIYKSLESIGSALSSCYIAADSMNSMGLSSFTS